MGSRNQLQLLIEVNSIYRDIAGITELILRVGPEERPALARRRGELIDYCQGALDELESLPPGGDLSEIKAQKELLRELILTTLSQDKLSDPILSGEKNDIRKRLREGLPRRRAVDVYKLNLREPGQ